MKDKNKKEKEINFNICFLKILMSICILFFISSYIFVFNYIFENKQYKRENENLFKGKQIVEIKDINVEENGIFKTGNMLKIEELQKENSDIVGWLEIENTNINYPVLQTYNNEFYLTHDYKKKYSKNGSIFLDKSVNIDIKSTNFLIYGHRNTAGLMFEDLIKYKKEEYYKKNPIIKFTTSNEESEYEIISVFLSHVYYKNEKNVFRYYYFINAKNEEEFNEYITGVKKNSIYNIEKTAVYGDQLLTLSTCEYSRKDGRLAIVAKKIKSSQK